MKPIKIVVFDLDETLGYFTELGLFWDSLIEYIKTEKINYKVTQHEFNETLDLFEEFIRPNIISVLNYLKYKKQTKICNSVLIYTNNQGTKEWATYIQKYFESKINYGLFDQVIGAFKINGKRYELCRTSHEKTIHDLLQCSKLPANTEICFLDDVLYPEMSGKNIYYIKVNPYIYNLPFETMIERFLTSELAEKIITNAQMFKTDMMKYMKRYAYTYIEKSSEEYEIDKIITKKTMCHLHAFFNKRWKESDPQKNCGTRKKRTTSAGRNKTFKKR
jgi:hypothetical protein